MKRSLFINKKALIFLIIQVLILTNIGNLLAQNSQEEVIIGSVKNEAMETLVGVNVVIKGTTEGTVSDFNGDYVINAPGDAILVFRFIGFKTKEVPVNNRTLINVSLEEDISELEEVTVPIPIGYGEVKRDNLLGAVSNITAKELEDIPATNITSLLEGRMAGVYVSPAQPTGNPVANTRVKIRETTTFGATSEGGAKDPTPLYIIDGFEVGQNEFEMLDPAEVESISVLKDAAASVYGSKGANGVLLVKTKRGKEGKISISYSGSQGVMDATTQTEMLSAYDQARFVNAMNSVDKTADLISDEELNRMKGLNYNWLDEAWKASVLSRNSVTISGGNEMLRFYGGGSYVYADGNFPGLGIGKHSYRLSMDADITEGLKASVSVSFNKKDYTKPYYSGSGANTMEDFFQALQQAPRWTPYEIDGKYVSNNVRFNPFALFNSNSFRQHSSRGNNLALNLSYEFKKIPGLKIEGKYYTSESHGYAKQYDVPFTTYEFAPADSGYLGVIGDVITRENVEENNNRINESYSKGESYELRTAIHYANHFGKHDISAFVLYEQGESSGYGFNATAYQMSIPNLALADAFNNTAAADYDGSMSEGGSLGAVSRLTYIYDEKYLLEASGRYEGTTKFAPGYRTGLFPSLAVGWIVTKENFFKERFGYISFLKLRASYGITGFPSVAPYEYEYTFQPSGSYLLGGGVVNGLGVSGKTDVVSTGVTWEVSRMLNYGFDMRLLENKLGISVDVFRTHQTDILDASAADLSQTSGITVMPSLNVGELMAWGYDATLKYNGRIGRDFKWNVRGVFNFSANKVLDRISGYSENDFRYPIGQSTFAVGREEGYQDKGIIRTQEQLEAINSEWNRKWGHDYEPFGQIAEVGMLYYQDIGRPGRTTQGEPPIVFEPDGIISEVNDKGYLQVVNDHFVWKNIFPSSLTMGASYKDLSFSMLWTMEYGIADIVVDKLARTGPSISSNAPAFWSDFYHADNINAAYPAPKFRSNNRLVSSFWMRDRKSLRFKTLTVSYSMPSKLSKRYNIPSFRVYLSGTNLWSPIQTFDYKEDVIARYNTYPLLRTFNLGINVKI